MITRDLDGEDIIARAQISDSLFRSLTEMWLAVYQDQYSIMGVPAVMSAKIIWDVAFYWVHRIEHEVRVLGRVRIDRISDVCAASLNER